MTTLLPLVAGAMPSEGERITSKGLRENRGPLVAKMQKLVEGAVAENREMTGEEQEEFDRLEEAQKVYERMAGNQAKIEQASAEICAPFGELSDAAIDELADLLLASIDSESKSLQVLK